MKLKRIVPIVAALAAIAAGASYAGIPGSSGVINGCYDDQGSLRVVDSAATCPAGETSLAWNQQGAAAVQEARTTVGAGALPSATVRFFTPPVPVTVSDEAQRVLVDATGTFGTAGGPGIGLNLFICRQQVPGPVTAVGHGLLNLRLPPNTTTAMGFGKVLQLPPSSSPYLVGLCGTGGVGWVNGGWGSTTALIVTPS